MKKVMILLLQLGLVLVCFPALKAQTPAVKTSYTPVEKDVVDIAISSPDHTTLVAAVQAAGLVETLKGDGPFTIFAPTNAAFEKLPAGTVDNLLKPANKDQLVNILTYHVVAGTLNAKDVLAAVEAGNGKAEVKALNGGTITAMVKNGEVYLMDEKGNMAKVTAVDLKGSNGVIHVIDSVIIPGQKKW